MEITENTICKFYFRRPKRKKIRDSAKPKMIFRDTSPAGKKIDPDVLAEKLGAEIIGEAKEKNKFFPLPFEFFAHAMAKHKKIISAIESLNGQTMALGEAVAQIKNNLKELFKESKAEIKLHINFERQIIFLGIENEHIIYKLFYFEPIR